ncbi:MAG TPA: hypothetical protein VL916_18175, partial [Ilumatobacteraceae bacterium]|nr:hypothetical protein [Ilumatobacteraceae bacterium]
MFRNRRIVVVTALSGVLVLGAAGLAAAATGVGPLGDDDHPSIVEDQGDDTSSSVDDDDDTSTSVDDEDEDDDDDATSSTVDDDDQGDDDGTSTSVDETMSSTMGDGDGDPGDGDGDPSGDGDGDTSSGDGDGDACTMEGCNCDGSADSCDDGLACIDGTCQTPSCSIDGVLDPGEQCD